MTKTREILLQSLVEKMINVIRNLHRGLCFSFGEFKLSRPQAMLLFFIAKQKEGASVKDLANYLNVTSGAITQFIDVLNEKDLVVRKEDPKDRRILRIILTESAKEKLKTFKKTYYKSMSPVFKDLNEKEIEDFIKLLSKINTKAEN